MITNVLLAVNVILALLIVISRWPAPVQDKPARRAWLANLRLWRPTPAAIILCLLAVMAQVGFYSKIRLNNACTIQTGSGSPESAITGAVCDLYLRTDGTSGTTLYVKETGSGNTGWAPAGSSNGLVVRKTADESVTSSTTLQNDDHLTFPIAASQVMAARYILFVDAGGTGDLKLGLSVPASGTYTCGSGAISNSTANAVGAQATSTTTVTVGGLGAGTIYEYVMDCTIVNSSTAGNVVLQWAQNTSDGTATILKTNSVVMIGSPSGGGGGTTYTAGNGIDITSNVISAKLNGTTLTNGASGLSVTAPAGMVMLESQTASSSAQLDFNSCISSSYDEYRFSFYGMRPVNDGDDLYARMSTNGGSSFDSGTNYDDAFAYVATNNTNAHTGNTGRTFFDFGGDQDTGATGYGLDGFLVLYNPNSTTTYKRMFGELLYAHDTTGNIFIRRGLVYKNTSAVNAVRFYYTGGNISSGTVRCYAMTH